MWCEPRSFSSACNPVYLLGLSSQRSVQTGTQRMVSGKHSLFRLPSTSRLVGSQGRPLPRVREPRLRFLRSAAVHQVCRRANSARSSKRGPFVLAVSLSWLGVLLIHRVSQGAAASDTKIVICTHAGRSICSTNSQSRVVTRRLRPDGVPLLFGLQPSRLARLARHFWCAGSALLGLPTSHTSGHRPIWELQPRSHAPACTSCLA